MQPDFLPNDWYGYRGQVTATGALLLFGAVQVTMIGWGLVHGERLDLLRGGGALLALAGLVGLVLPGLTAPPLVGAGLMLAAGIAWGIYSLRGRGGGDAIATTAGNFARALPFAAVLGVALAFGAEADGVGIGCAVASGALASGLGYAIWYGVLPALSATSAASVQLSAPVIAALGGVFFLGEPITLRLVLASLAILGGIALVIIGRRTPSPP